MRTRSLRKWKKCRKKPIVVEFREVIATRRRIDKFEDVNVEIIKTREGTLEAVEGRDFVIRGVEGEIYPISKDIFYKTYEVVE